MARTERICVAKIGAAHGVRGEVRLHAYTDEPMALASLGLLEDESGARQFRIVSLRPGKGHLIARLEGIEDRTAAERLTNMELFVARDRLPELEQGSYYHADLVGLRVESTDGGLLGTVVAVQNFGAGDLIEIAPVNGGDTVMVPFHDRFVPAVDIAGGRMVIDPPAGTFDERRSAQ